MQKTPRRAPYWIVGGDQQCSFCLQPYAYPMEVRCTDCDRPACPLCAERSVARTGRLCPECTSAAA